VKIQGREFSPESEEREKLRTYEKKKVGSQKRRKKYREREKRRGNFANLSAAVRRN